MFREKHNKLTMSLFLLLAICFCTLPAQAKYGGGTGEPNDPYLIYTAEQMNAIGTDPCDWDKHFLLCADIDLSGYTGTSFNIIGNFTGVFEGNNHTIANFTYTSTGPRNVGLFGYVRGEIKDLGLIDPNIDVGIGEYVGSLAVRNYGTITNCCVEGGCVSGEGAVGGLVGKNGWCCFDCPFKCEPGTISNCYSTSSVSGTSTVGGLVGENYYYITNCYSTGSVSGEGAVGGLVGRNGSYSPEGFSFPGTISNCYSTGIVLGGERVGGLVGENEASAITNCYSTSSVSGDDGIGGLVGGNICGTITNCRSAGSVTGTTDVGGLVGTNDDFFCRSTINNCYSNGNVSGEDSVGGLVGYNHGGGIANCYSNGDVSGTTSVGGLVGTNGMAKFLGKVINCYSTGSVTGDLSVGGLVGGNGGYVTDCYSISSVSGGHNVGGLVGANRRTISKCYSMCSVSGSGDYVGGLVGYSCVYAESFASFWNIETSGQTSSAGGEGKTTAEMLTTSTFTDAGWDFVGETINGSENIWRLCVDGTGYPQLNWQFLLGDFLCPDRMDFIDYSFFASHWLQDNCGETYDCEGTDLDQLGSVDINDLAIFVGNWLAVRPPGQAHNPNPTDGATGVDIEADLSWLPGNWAALHEVYFGTDPCALPLVATQSVGQESYDPPGDLIPDMTYYWCIDEVSTYGTIMGTVWSFTTIPGKAHTPSPADGSVIPGVEYEYPPDSGNWYIWTMLTFNPGPTADPDPNVRRAYFSENYNDVVNRVEDANLGPPPYGSTPGYETRYYVGSPEIPPAIESLVRGTIYYWCVDETDDDGRTFPGDIWEFTIQGYKAFAPNPANEAVWVDPNVVLSWGEGYGVQDHDIYLGTSWEDVDNADANDTTGIYRGFESNPQYQCTSLEYLTTYYWRVDEVQGRLPPLFPGIIYKGDVWSFTTGVPTPP